MKSLPLLFGPLRKEKKSRKRKPVDPLKKGNLTAERRPQGMEEILSAAESELFPTATLFYWWTG